MIDFIVGHYNYWMYVGLMMIGFYAMMAKKNLVKKVIGMNIFQSAIILFYISTSVKRGGVTIPILEHVPGGHGPSQTGQSRPWWSAPMARNPFRPTGNTRCAAVIPFPSSPSAIAFPWIQWLP